jgi:hypothetical protein
MGPRPAPAELGGGFTVAGATLLLTVLSAAGALVDALVFDRLVWAFGALFCLGCTWIALRLRRRDRRAAFVVPPLVYAAIVVVAALVSGDRAGLRQEAFDAVLLLSDRAPVLICGLVLVLVITVVRARRRHAG